MDPEIRVDPNPVADPIAGPVREWLSRVGIKTLYIEPGSPWENSHNESFNGKLRDDLLNGEIFYTLKEAQILIERWRLRRWQIELFFKWIKQNLKIKAFYGTSKSAVLIQIWTALTHGLVGHALPSTTSEPTTFAIQQACGIAMIFRAILVGKLPVRNLGLNALRRLRSREHRVIQIIIHIVFARYLRKNTG